MSDSRDRRACVRFVPRRRVGQPVRVCSRYPLTTCLAALTDTLPSQPSK